MGVSYQAQAVCPNPSSTSYTAGTSYEFRPSDQVPAQNVAGADDCFSDDFALWCEVSYAMVPDSTIEQRDSLFLWFPGVNVTPSQTQFIPELAASVGYRTISLAWDNAELTRAGWCQDGDVFGGYCDDSCLFDTGYEMLYGIDDSGTDYLAHPMRGIEARLGMALEHLHRRDLNLNGTNDEDWNEFCHYDSNTGESVIHWNAIEVGGFSMGAQMASFISYIEPGLDPYESIGLLAVEGGAEACGVDFSLPETDPARDPSNDYFPDEYNEHGTIPPCGESSACIASNRFMVAHDDGKVLPPDTFRYGDTSLLQVGISNTVYDTDGPILTNTFPIIPTNNLISTNVPMPAGCGGHTAPAIDACMYENSPAPFTIAMDANDTYLAPLYVSALCELDQP